MNRTLCLTATAALLVLSARPAYAWDEFGHRVIARIAWQEMTPQARARAIQVLQGASADMRLAQGFSGPLSPQRQIELFLNGSTWPDDVRPPDSRGARFHVRDRHFVNLFWRQNSDFGPVVPLSVAPKGDLLNHLPRLLNDSLRSSNRARAARALAWVLHLVGDIHQPLHNSARVTPLDRLPDGDRGGNSFRLQGSLDNLHSFWDNVVDRNTFRPGEPEPARVERVAAELATHFPRGGFSGELAVTDFRTWSDAGVRLAQTNAYADPLARNSFVPQSYERQAFDAAKPRMALAGYRLADILNRAFPT
ncbi:MAG TPA: S1/P1 nuclease [Longimicrobium sp.]|nr:S1/P1 nuclease [Longimicrobium sp.]